MEEKVALVTYSVLLLMFFSGNWDQRMLELVCVNLKCFFSKNLGVKCTL